MSFHQDADDEACGRRRSLNEVLREEVSALGFDALQGVEAAGFDTDAGPDHSVRDRNLAEIYRRLARVPLAALCVSGGGIRSATFNLGIIQALARIGLLGRFHYLSSVSGGGYIASWLRTWMRREGAERVIEQLCRTRPASPLDPEPRPVRLLRAYSNYLTPKLGLFSADTWTAVAIVLRNMLLNWLVILPLIGAAVAVPQVLLLVVRSIDFGEEWGRLLLYIALFLEVVASVLIYAFRRFKKKPGTSQSVYVWFCVLPIWLAATALSAAGLGLDLPWKHADRVPTEDETRGLCLFATLWCVVIPFVGWGVCEIAAKLKRRAPGERERSVSYWMEGLALVISGVVAAALLVEMIVQWMAYLHSHAAWYVASAVPLLLAVYFVARSLFVAIAGLASGWVEKKGRCVEDAATAQDTRRMEEEQQERRASSQDADREWWARLSGWVMIVVVSWMLVAALSLAGGHLPGADVSGMIRGVIAALGGAAGIVAAVLGHHEKTPGPASRPQQTSLVRRVVLLLAAPVFVVCVIVLIGWGTGYLEETALGMPGILSLSTNAPAASQPITVDMSLLAALVPLGLALLAVVASFIVNVNRFSMHGMYRNRLVRAYLGASNARREPDPFTGFDLRDNLSLHELWKAPESTRPLPIINCALNLVAGEDLAWQQRRAESFSMTPFYCGNFAEGYRSSLLYGGSQGISLGTAVTISGAAANPNMGFASSPAIGFLLALFNARLGAWLGNTNARGEHTYRRGGPRFALLPLIAELFGLTNRNSGYVNLSDGGHFDNLGLYEVVLRRCRYILVCDAGQDKSFAFDDLGNAIRKVRIDFGIPIDFRHRILIRPRDDGTPKTSDAKGLYCAIADIRYSAVDQPGEREPPVPDGVLIYIKPTLRGWTRDDRAPPYDVYSYSQNQPDFPHEPTSDQWFSESQFESYRKLGQCAIEDIVRGHPPGEETVPAVGAQPPSMDTFEQFVEAVEHYIDDAAKELNAARASTG